MHLICKAHNLKQIVAEPTRGNNLLDLALSSLGSDVSASVVPGISDHKGVLATVGLPVPKLHVIERTVWEYKKADWNCLNDALRNIDFNVGNYSDIDIAVSTFVALVLSEASKFIPTRGLRKLKGTHPWLDDACCKTILHKHFCEGTAGHKDAADQCTNIFRFAYFEDINKKREELRALPKGLKRWCSLSKVLMDNALTKSRIPSLREPRRQIVAVCIALLTAVM